MDDTTRLLLAARDGDRDAFAEFVRRTQPEVHRLCRALSSPSAADDLTQETYLRALDALGRFRGRSSARTWLLAIARNVAADDIRRRGARGRLLSRLGGPDEPMASPGAMVHTADLLARLHPDRRDAFALTQLLGLSYAEAAEVLDCPVGTIRSRVARAREDLVDALRDPRAEETG
ncbi:sigma-70 family RNA polymerase sigma factor [Rhabdothermincola salaria]|uniref:sigma-70 family RNA polymerase sigma factor n=1 Tax=Rhabdothermincola salaria TaxID=2903142 RepID=UPI00321197DE